MHYIISCCLAKHGPAVKALVGTTALASAPVEGDGLMALVQARKAVRRGKPTCIVMDFADLIPPAGMRAANWEVAWLLAARESRVEVRSVGRRIPGIPPGISRHVDASARMADRLRQAECRPAASRTADSPFAGRPPHGYSRRSKGGPVKVDPALSKEVRVIFESARKHLLVGKVVDEAKRLCPGRWFDRVKVGRILGHARLYCLGEVRVGTAVQVFPSLAFLPPAWVDTPDRVAGRLCPAAPSRKMP